MVMAARARVKRDLKWGGDSAGDDDGVTAKTRPWSGGLDRRAYGGTPRTARPVRRGQSAARGPGGLQGA
jgi:hypothetical protein